MIVIEVDGVQYGGFTRASVSLRLDALSNTFSFDATSERANALPFSGGQACRIFADEELVVSGNIEIVSVSYTAGNHSITFEGRDKTGDLLDSSLASLSDLKAPITLAKICQRVISHIGADILVIDELNPAVFKAAEDIASPEPGENAFQFLEKYSRKRQALLSSNALGNLLITASSGLLSGGSVIHRVGNPGNANNVIAADMSYDSTGRYNLYRSVSQLNTSAGVLAGFTNATTVASQGNLQGAIDDEIRSGRQLILVSEAATSGKSCLDRATWEANIRKARGKVYSAEVVGFRNQAGDLWEINTLPQVVDEFAGIEARMLLNSVVFSNSVSDGSEKTILGLLNRNAYTLQLQEPITETETTGGGGLFG
jgi:prophage tail gpP-like protein